jgi:hypothetical protein
MILVCYLVDIEPEIGIPAEVLLCLRGRLLICEPEHVVYGVGVVVFEHNIFEVAFLRWGQTNPASTSKYSPESFL